MENRYNNSTFPKEYFPIVYYRILTRSFIILFLFFTLIIHTNAQPYSEKKLILKAVNYELDIHIDYAKKKLNGICGLTVINTTSEEGNIIPLLLYRLMKVTSIRDEKGNALVYTQKVLSFEDCLNNAVY